MDFSKYDEGHAWKHLYQDSTWIADGESRSRVVMRVSYRAGKAPLRAGDRRDGPRIGGRNAPWAVDELMDNFAARPRSSWQRARKN